MAITTIIFGVVLYIIMKRGTKYVTGEIYWPRSKVIWFLFGSFTLQGTDMDCIRRSSSRILIGTWFLIIFVLVSSYAGLLVAIMSTPIYETVPSTFAELEVQINNGRFVSGTLEGNIITRFFMDAKRGSAKLIADNMRKCQNMPKDEESGIKRVLNERFAYIMHDVGIQHYTELYGSERFVVSKDVIATYPASFGLQKNSPYKDKLNRKLYGLLGGGLISKLDKHRRSTSHYVEERTEFGPLRLENFLSSFLLLLAGYCLSTICFLLELWLGKRK